MSWDYSSIFTKINGSNSVKVIVLEIINLTANMKVIINDDSAEKCNLI